MTEEEYIARRQEIDSLDGAQKAAALRALKIETKDSYIPPEPVITDSLDSKTN
jgi:hypothetical protein